MAKNRTMEAKHLKAKKEIGKEVSFNNYMDMARGVSIPESAKWQMRHKPFCY